MAAFADRELSETAFPRVPLGATYYEARIGGGKGSRVASQAVVVATEVSGDGRREVFGFAVGDSEDGAFGPRSCARLTRIHRWVTRIAPEPAR